MPDKYHSFSELTRSEVVNVDYRTITRDQGPTLILAPHAGKIEPGTSELAEAIAATGCSLYLFEGLKRSNNRDLHITSTHFDEPGCLRALQRSETVLAIHGEDSKAPVVYIGGRDRAAKGRIARALRAAGFDVQEGGPHLAGEALTNVCNRGRTGAGVQLEISAGMRRTFFRRLYSGVGREHKTEDFDRFVRAASEGLHVAAVGQQPRNPPRLKP
jgi:phage replication-related protein YjqB (UPF0714/DUF867 family)